MLNNSTIDAKRLKSMLVKTRGNEKLRIALMLAVLVVQRKLTPFLIAKRKNILK
jgi:hypothetical protein